MKFYLLFKVMIVQLDTIYVNVMWRCHFKNDRKQ